jgi:hypothetical protein
MRCRIQEKVANSGWAEHQFERVAWMVLGTLSALMLTVILSEAWGSWKIRRDRPAMYRCVR